MASRFTKVIATIALVLIASFGSTQFAVYEKASAEVNLTFKPLGLLLGILTARLDIPVSEKLVIGPELMYWNFSLGDASLTAQGAGVNFGYYFAGNFTDSWYVTPALGFASAIDNESSTGSATYASVTGGYHWFWDSFNLRLGLGVVTGLGSSTIEVQNSDGTTEEVDAGSRYSGGTVDFAIGFYF